MTYRVCIPTAGTGSRLGELTCYVNKSLVGIANRPALCHIIEQFPTDVEFVIGLGYKGELIREFLELVYPERTFFFSEVSQFEGEGTGLGLTLLSCREFLQQPFVFISCDTLVKGEIAPPDHNWMGYAEVEDTEHYRTLHISSRNLVGDIHEKGHKGTSVKAYIGLAGINDYEEFWHAMVEGDDIAIQTGETHGMRAILDFSIRGYSFEWFDTGNIEALTKAREAYKEADSPNILDKANEAIWFVGDKVVKFSHDVDFIRNRVERGSQISQFTPKIVDYRDHMFMYQKVHGYVLSEVVNAPLFERLLSHCKAFWKPHSLDRKEYKRFKEICRTFYKSKTEERVRLFFNNFKRADGCESINGEPMSALAELLEGLDWDWLTSGYPGRYHGDLHFENILWSEEEDRFVFLDWRQEFGGDIATGDIYYDFAKLMHGLIVSHEIIANGSYHIKWQKRSIDYDLTRKQSLVECERRFEEWLQKEGFDVKKVRVLTALIYLNIAVLHHYPYSLLLHALGKRMLRNEFL